MTARLRHCLPLRLLVVAALLLRIAIPAGYMPASVASDGWYLQWCPDGIPAEVMAALFEATAPPGAAAHHHHHLHGEPAAGAESAPASAGPTRCDFGLLGADAHAAPQALPDDTRPMRWRPLRSAATVVVDEPLRLAYRSRAPPRVHTASLQNPYAT